MELSIIEAIWG